MPTHRRLAAVLAAPLLVTALIEVLAAAPAQAHGALNNPISRVVACGPEGGSDARSAACQAAIKVSGAEAFAAWDNLRVPDVNGRDRQLIPDGQLCSGGLDAYRGLDLARADWPATKLTSGADFTFTYRTTIPHQGSFRMYVTKDSYDPAKPLTWADLEAKPFLTATNPPIRGGAYVMPGRLPAGKSGRHLIYTIWQTTSTPDTYYSCSDVIFSGPGGAGGAGSTPAAGTGRPSSPPAGVIATTPAAPSPVAATGTPSAPAAVALTRTSSSRSMLPVAVGAVALLALAGATGTFLWRRRRMS
jgi:predicted carbohydrate-binding protein with CBM5 and CBM33 domain